MKFDVSVPTNAMISVIYRKHARYINQKVKTENLTYGLYPLLIDIYRHDGLIQEKLAENFQLNESTITRNLNKLEEKGFIKRTKHERKKIITATELGKQTAQKVMNYDEQWDEKIKKLLGEEEYKNFKETLIKISKEVTYK